MDLLIFLSGVIVGAALWAWLRARLQRTETSEPLSVTVGGPRPGRRFPSLSEADLETAIRRTHRDEHSAEKDGLWSLARKARDDRAAYERELAERRRAAV